MLLATPPASITTPLMHNHASSLPRPLQGSAPAFSTASLQCALSPAPPVATPPAPHHAPLCPKPRPPPPPARPRPSQTPPTHFQAPPSPRRGSAHSAVPAAPRGGLGGGAVRVRGFESRVHRDGGRVRGAAGGRAGSGGGGGAEPGAGGVAHREPPVSRGGGVRGWGGEGMAGAEGV